MQFIKFGQRQSVLLDILDISKNEPIREMEISQKTGSLYIATDHSVKQIDLAMCNRRYDSCFRCVKDPYCGWDKDTGACKPYQLGLLQVSHRFRFTYLSKRVHSHNKNRYQYIWSFEPILWIDDFVECRGGGEEGVFRTYIVD